MPESNKFNNNSEVVCPICTSPRARVIGAKGAYDIGRCRACGHLFSITIPTPETLNEFYRVYSYEVYDLSRVPEFAFTVLNDEVTAFEPYRRTNRFLEVGFGAGAMLQVAQKRGWETYGIETSALAVQKAQGKGHSAILEVDFLAAPYPEGHFDVIVALGVLEHLPNPLPVINQAARLLSPRGVFYATTPNGAGISPRLLGLDWSTLCPPEHIHLFSPKSLGLALAQRGFSKVSIACEGTNPHEVLHHLRRKLRPKGGIEAGSENVFDHGATSTSLNQQLMSNRAGSALKKLANVVLRRTRLGDTLKAFATKEG